MISRRGWCYLRSFIFGFSTPRLFNFAAIIFDLTIISSDWFKRIRVTKSGCGGFWKDWIQRNFFDERRARRTESIWAVLGFWTQMKSAFLDLKIFFKVWAKEELTLIFRRLAWLLKSWFKSLSLSTLTLRVFAKEIIISKSELWQDSKSRSECSKFVI